MQKTIKAFIYSSETHDIAECMGINVVTQGKTLDETVANLREAIYLFLENEDLSQLGFAPNPTLIATFEIESPFHNTMV